jgi:hypothetical protein
MQRRTRSLDERQLLGEAQAGSPAAHPLIERMRVSEPFVAGDLEQATTAFGKLPFGGVRGPAPGPCRGCGNRRRAPVTSLALVVWPSSDGRRAISEASAMVAARMANGIGEASSMVCCIAQ